MVRTDDIYVKKPFLRDDVLLKLQLFLSQPNSMLRGGVEFWVRIASPSITNVCNNNFSSL